MSALHALSIFHQTEADVFMAVETFDQRFKRLTSDLLMLDICRMLGIEVRDLMKIRQGIRVQLNMDKVKRLCLDQGLDFMSFTRDYDQPWSAENKPAEVITSDTPAPARRRTVEAAAPATPNAQQVDASDLRFRNDGSRIVEKHLPKTPVAPIPAVRSSQPPASPVEDVRSVPSGIGVVGRLKAAVATAAALLGSNDAPAAEVRREDNRVPTSHGEVDSYNYPEPRKIGGGDWNSAESQKLQTVLEEVTDLRREVSVLATRINELIGR
jgi:hypothetical protein